MPRCPRRPVLLLAALLALLSLPAQAKRSSAPIQRSPLDAWTSLPPSSPLATARDVALGAGGALTVGPDGSRYLPNEGEPVLYGAWPRFERLHASNGAVFGESAPPSSWPQGARIVFAWRPGLEWQFTAPCPIAHLAASGDGLFIACADGHFEYSTTRGMEFTKVAYPPPTPRARVKSVGITPHGGPAVLWEEGKQSHFRLNPYRLGSLETILTTTETSIAFALGEKGWALIGFGGKSTPKYPTREAPACSASDKNRRNLVYAPEFSFARVCGDTIHWSTDDARTWNSTRFPGPITFATGGGSRLLVEAAGRRWIRVVGKQDVSPTETNRSEHSS